MDRRAAAAVGVLPEAVTAHLPVAATALPLPRPHLRAAVMELLPEAVMEVRRPAAPPGTSVSCPPAHR